MKLTISMAQMDVIDSKPEENLRKGEGFIAEAARRKSDIICFPEMWTTALNWKNNVRIASLHEEIISRIGELAKKYKIWIDSPTLALNDDGLPANSSIMFDPKGNRAATYYKTHLFSGVKEDKYMAPGNALCVVDAPWGKTGLAVCYDIRFPELFRMYTLAGVKIIFLPAAFPDPKSHHWKALLRARAIENQIFMVGVNRAGRQDFGKGGTLTYFGASSIIDPWGDIVVEAGASEELITVAIDMKRVEEIRSEADVIKDRRPGLYNRPDKI